MSKSLSQIEIIVRIKLEAVGFRSSNRKKEKQMQKLLEGMQQKHPALVNRSKNFLNSWPYHHLQNFVNFT